MPPKRKFKREEIAKAALSVIRKKGYTSLTARSVAAELRSSAKVIFSSFENMDDLHKEIIAEIDLLYMQFIAEEFATGKYPPYQASGMAFIRLAKEETELFKMRYMRDRTKESFGDNSAANEPIIMMIQKSLGISRENAQEINLQLWVYVHGIAAMIATNYIDFELQQASNVLTKAFNALKSQYQTNETTVETARIPENKPPEPTAPTPRPRRRYFTYDNLDR
ncbi:MAG: TetR/AcrR family transcriptional regulator [Christensenellaceae bacterium]|nr:TetR/AcrR family transcriptional regulator [Christensenellaceae bacterium]